MADDVMALGNHRNLGHDEEPFMFLNLIEQPVLDGDDRSIYVFPWRLYAVPTWFSKRRIAHPAPFESLRFAHGSQAPIAHST